MEYSSINNPKKLENLVFLHGWGGCWQSWYPILEALKNNFNLYAPNLPGSKENPISKVYNLNDYINFTLDFIKKNKIKKPILIGHSFGGAIISKIAAKKLIPIKKIILVDAAPIRYKLNPKQKLISSITKSIKPIFSIPIIKQFYQPSKELLYKSLGLQNAGYSDLIDPILKKTFTTVIREDLSPILHQIKIPTLIIWGSKDTATPLSAGKKINSLIPNSELIVYPNSGHFSYLDQQKKFIQDIKKFIEK